MTEVENIIIKVIKRLEDIAGGWNGDESGTQEDDANEALELIANLKQFLKQHYE